MSRKRGVLFSPVALALLLFLAGGCATLPERRLLSGLERQGASELFLEAVARQQGCGDSLDVQARLVVKSLLQNGSLAGFLQAMAPASLKFVGINPLGQPLLVLVTDGRSFRTLVVPEAKAYEGEVSAALFRKYAPEGFAPEQGFYWLTGRLPGQGLRVEGVSEDAEGAGQWFEVSYPGEPLRRHLLFDPAEAVIRRHLLVDADGAMVLDVRYDAYRHAVGAEGCALPGAITVTDRGKSGARMELTMSDWLPAAFSAEDFLVSPPPGFERVIIK